MPDHNIFIPYSAGLSVRHLLPGPDKLPFLDKFKLRERQIVFTFTGSTALGLAADSLKRKNKTHLLAPSFHCGHEIEPFARKNYKISLYRIDRKGNVDINHLNSLLDDQRQIVLVTHYFGFPQNISKITEMCRSKGIFIIEDCAHSFQTKIKDRLVGSWGDISIFSYRKTLPLPDGGALIVNNPNIPLSFPTIRPLNLALWRKTIKLLLDGLIITAEGNSPLYFRGLYTLKRIILHAKSLLNLYSNEGNLHLYSPDDPSYNYSSDIFDWKISKTSLRIMNKLDLENIFHARRHNYRYLGTGLNGAKCLHPLFADLPDGVCPLSLPVVAYGDIFKVKKVMRRYSLIHPWWPDNYPGVDIKSFPESQWLKERCYVISINQDMKKKHLDYFIDYTLKADQEIYTER